MLDIAAARVPRARFLAADALSLPFADGSFERVFTGHLYGHLEGDARPRFLAEARRVGEELVVVDSALRQDVSPEERQDESSLTAHGTRSTSASSPARGWRRSSAGARCFTRGAGS
jgi:ubiquinone/menaquinone biosynthesis C-methylase UbiE